MATLTVLCEGATEQNFVRLTLAPYLREMSVYANSVNLGGAQTLAQLHRQINDSLRARRSHEYVTTMLDLYALGRLPGNEPVPGESARERVARIEQSLYDRFPNPNFIPYIQVHEFEALVFVDIDKIRTAFPDGEADAGIPKLKASIAGTEPEMVDDGVNTAPSKRIIAEISGYAGRKSSAGPEIVQAIGIERLRNVCFHFSDWLSRLESLGGVR